MKVSKYRATHSEANFGKPIVTQVAGGTHITFELVTKKEDQFYMTCWPKGLPGHDDPPNSLRFPHGLIRFGETMDQCVKRLVTEQLGMTVKGAKIVDLDSYLDDSNHWHIEPCCLVEVRGKPRVPKFASEVVVFGAKNLPKMTFWTRREFMQFIRGNIPSLL